MNLSEILERRRLRRRVGWWRAAAAIFSVLAIVLICRIFVSSSVTSMFERPHIAQLTISGEIYDDTDLLKVISQIEEDPKVKALIVSISTGGGSTYGGEVLYKALRSVAEKKPVVSEIRTVAASAGYMIALAGDQILLVTPLSPGQST